MGAAAATHPKLGLKFAGDCRRSGHMNSFDVSSWWYLLCATAAFNVLAWTLSVAVVRRDQASMSPDAYIDCRRQLILSAIYVFGCAFRSAHPVFDIPRLVLFN